MREALLVIDVQVALVKGAYREPEVLQAINRSIGTVRARGGTVIFIRHCHATFEPMMKGAAGWAVHPSLDQRSDDLTIDKTASDSFYKTSLHDCLGELDVDHVLVAGLQTEFCVDTTCRAALSLGYQTTLISDAHTTGESRMSAQQIIDHHEWVLSNIAHPSGSVALCRSGDL